MNILTVILLAVVFAFGSCSNADDDYLPPNSDIVTALHELYPGVKDIEWSQKGVYYVADCWVDGNELNVWFEEQLPEAVNTAYLESNYADWVIDDITKLTYPSKAEEYLLEVQRGTQERALYYSAYGGLLKEKDITGADFTHWPEM